MVRGAAELRHRTVAHACNLLTPGGLAEMPNPRLASNLCRSSRCRVPVYDRGQAQCQADRGRGGSRERRGGAFVRAERSDPRH
jgi:hypothetical protein